MLLYPVLQSVFYIQQSQCGNSASGISVLIMVYYIIIQNVFYLLNQIITATQESPVSRFQEWETYFRDIFSRMREIAGLI